eukprot:11214510-Lingulodinium_polyedra.AAC.1
MLQAAVKSASLSSGELDATMAPGRHRSNDLRECVWASMLHHNVLTRLCLHGAWACARLVSMQGHEWHLHKSTNNACWGSCFARGLVGSKSALCCIMRFRPFGLVRLLPPDSNQRTSDTRARAQNKSSRKLAPPLATVGARVPRFPPRAGGGVA